MPNLMYKLFVDRVDLVDEGSNSAAFIKLFKRKEGTSMPTFEDVFKSLKTEHQEIVTAEIEKAKTASLEELNKAKEELEVTEKEKKEANEKLSVATEELAKAKEELDTVNKAKPTEEDVIKGLDPAVQAIFKTLQDKAAAAEELTKRAAEEKVEAEALEKANTLKGLPIDTEVLKSCIKEGIPAALLTALETVAKALETSDLFKSIGNSKPGTTDAWAMIEAEAVTVAKAKNLTKEAAVAEVIKANPELYKQYMEERN